MFRVQQLREKSKKGQCLKKSGLLFHFRRWTVWRIWAWQQSDNEQLGKCSVDRDLNASTTFKAHMLPSENILRNWEASLALSSFTFFVNFNDSTFYLSTGFFVIQWIMTLNIKSHKMALRHFSEWQTVDRHISYFRNLCKKLYFSAETHYSIKLPGESKKR